MAIVGRATSLALIPEDAQKEIVKGALNKSAVRQLMSIRPMTRQQQRIPVTASYPTASWLSSETAQKPTTSVSWDNVYLYAEEIATIVVIPISLVKDVDYPIWDQIVPLVQEAFAITLDDTILFGTNKPASWPAAIIPQAVTASNQVVAGTSSVDTLEDINQAMKAVEDDGFEVTGLLARSQFKSFLRGIRDGNKGFLYDPEGPANAGAANANVQMGMLYGEKLAISRSGIAGFATSASNYSLVAGDWKQAILGVREDVEGELFKEGIVQDTDGSIQHNLMQEDKVAMRFVGRFAYAVPNPLNRMNPTAATRWPFSVLKQRASTGGE